MAIDESEIEDFRADIEAAGHDPGDFDVSEERLPPPREAGGVFVEKATVTVTRKKNGVARSYAAGYGTAWVVAFMRDLRAGAFGR